MHGKSAGIFRVDYQEHAFILSDNNAKVMYSRGMLYAEYFFAGKRGFKTN